MLFNVHSNELKNEAARFNFRVKSIESTLNSTQFQQLQAAATVLIEQCKRDLPCFTINRVHLLKLISLVIVLPPFSIYVQIEMLVVVTCWWKLVLSIAFSFLFEFVARNRTIASRWCWQGTRSCCWKDFIKMQAFPTPPLILTKWKMTWNVEGEEANQKNSRQQTKLVSSRIFMCWKQFIFIVKSLSLTFWRE